MTVIELEHVSLATPAGRPLLNDVTCSIGPGVTALVGANGSGKSTLLRAVATVHPLRRGRIRVNGIDRESDRAAYLSQLAFLPQTFSAYPDLTGREFLEYSLQLRGADQKNARAVAATWLREVGLESAADRCTGAYSQGMLQRLGVASVLQIDASVYVLDEPFAGVDPESCAAIADRLFAIGETKVVLVSTHEVDSVARRGARVLQVNEEALE